MRGALRCLFLVTVCSLLLTATARADGIKITQRLINGDGWPSLVANYIPDGSRGTASWSVCAPDCGPVIASGAFYAPGPTAIGTTFEASATVDGTTTTDRSPVWSGQVTNTAPPTFAGEPRAGQTLTPVAGTWTGGWGDEQSKLGIRACPTAAAQDCRKMTDIRSTSQVTIDPAYAGWYVGALEWRIGSGSVFTADAIGFRPGYVSPYPAMMPGQTVAVGPLTGPVIGSPTPSEPPTVTEPSNEQLRFTPRVTIRKRALRQGTALKLASISCSGRCVAHATLRHARRAVTRRIIVTGGRASIKLLRGTFSRHATKVRVAVRFDRHPATASGSVKLR